MNNPEPPIQTASVKVMRSHDYCHFEVCLSTGGPCDAGAVDALRKTAARLADKAVAQYRVAKTNAELALQDEQQLDMLRHRHGTILDRLQKGEALTPEEKAILKAIADRAHFSRRRYDYEDEWQEETFGDDPDDSAF